MRHEKQRRAHPQRIGVAAPGSQHSTADDEDPRDTGAGNSAEPAAVEMERHRTLVENASDGIFVSDVYGRFEYVNPAGCDMLGYSRDEILSLTIADIIAPEEAARLQHEIARLSATPVKSEWRFRREDGSTFEGEVNVRQLPDLRLLAILRDISPLQNALGALRESESRFRALIEDLEIGVVLQDAEDRILIANTAARSMLGITVDELSGVTARDPRWRLIQEDGTPFPPDRVPSVLAARTLQPVRNVLVGETNLETGARKWLQVTASPRLTDGRLQHVLVTIIDVTEHRTADQRLQDSRRHLLASQHVARVGSWELEVSPDGRANLNSLTCSDESFRIFGYLPDETAPPIDLFWSRVHPDDRARIENAFNAALTGRDVYELDHRIKLPDGSVRVIHERAELVRHPVTSAGTRLIGTANDITDRLWLEEQLRQSQKMHALGQLAGGVAHDFNNVLTVITNSSDMLLHQLADAPAATREVLQAIHDAGQRAALLTRQLLVFSRKAMVEPRVLDLNDVIRHTARMLRRLIPENIAMNTRLDPGLSRIRLDRGQLEQVILNLALNARDALERGGELTLTTRNANIDADALPRSEPEVRPGRFAQLVVSDTGAGMSPEVQSHLFEPFFTTKDVGKGTGLGLATVYGIVRAAGGFITVTTAEGVGTTFTVSLPVAEEAEPTEHGPSAPAITERSKETILLVEDEDAVRTVLRRALESDGYQVLEAPNGRVALEIMEREAQRVSLVLTDVVMPEMNGRDLASHVRTRFPDCRVLLMSGYFQEGPVSGGRGAAVAALPLLHKPFPLAELSAKVRETIGRPA
jgi:PAS domain S-box-containing protein